MSATFDQEIPMPPGSGRDRPRRPRGRSLRLAAGAVATAAALSVAVPSIASAAPIREQGSAAYHAHHARAVLPLMTGKVGDASCDNPNSAVARVAASKRVAASRRVSGSGGKLGGDPPAATSILNDFLSSLGSNAAAFAEDDGFGWALSLLGNQQPSIDPAEIDAQFAQVDSQLSAISRAQYDDCNAILNTLAMIKDNEDRNTYDTLVSGIKTDTTYLTDFQQEYDQIVEALQKNGGNVNALSPTYTQDLADMLSGTDGLPNVVNQIISQEESQNGIDGMASFYGKVLTDQYNWDPYTTHIFPAAFVNDGYAQQDYYASLIVQAVYIYTNAAHLKFTIGRQHYTTPPSDIVNLVNTAQAGIAKWSAEFSDGPNNDGTADYVSQGKNLGIGPLPADTVLDYRVQNQPMLWTTAPVNLADGTSSAAAPYYCGTTARFCYAAQYPLPLAPLIGDLRLAAPSPQPLAALIAGAHYDGLTGWRVPTLSDWTTVAAGAGSTSGTGLGVWGPANQLPMFTPQTMTSHFGGMDSSASVIPPMLYATGDSSQPYGVLTNANPNGSNLLNPLHSTDPSGESDLAGRLFLVQDFQATPPPPPMTVSGQHAQTAHTPATHPAGSQIPASHPAATRGPAATARAYNRSQAARTDLGPATFSTPAPCLANSSETYTVPAGAGMVRVTATGGAGAAGTNHDGTANPGGRGGMVTETFPVTPGQTLYIQVGGAGHGPQRGVGGGAGGGTTSVPGGTTSGGGGGASGVSSTPGCSNWLLVGGGGGGGGAGGYLDPDGGPPVVFPGGTGGDGCAMTGGPCTPATAGHQGAGDAAGAGGTPPDNEGGTAASGAPASSAGAAGATMAGGEGGTDNDAYSNDGGGGGGGGGYYGGGGGGGAGMNQANDGPGGGAAGGGGGGASFAIPGGSDISYGLGDPGQDGSVTITPLVPAPPQVSVSASAGETTWGQPVTLTATVPASATGTVTFTDGGQNLGTAPILGGTATLATPSTLDVGAHQIVASYSGDTSYAPSQSDPVTVQVDKATPAMALTVTGTVLAPGHAPKSLVVQMPADATGSVGFYDDINGGCDGSTALGAKCQGEGVAPIVNGYATLTNLTVPLTDGTHYLHASYGGDGHYTGYQSNPVTITVGSAPAAQPASHHQPAIPRRTATP